MEAVSSIVLGVSGGLAASKAAFVLRAFTEAGHDVRVVPTPGALHFVGAATFEALSGNPVTTDVWSDVPEVAHVRIRQAAELVVVAPATADLLARAAMGRADDLLTATLLTAPGPVVSVPATHTAPWPPPPPPAAPRVLAGPPRAGHAHRDVAAPGPPGQRRHPAPAWRRGSAPGRGTAHRARLRAGPAAGARRYRRPGDGRAAPRCGRARP